MDFAAVLGALRASLGERTTMAIHVAVMVAEHADGIDQLDLAHLAQIPPNTLTKMLRELRDEGLVTSAVHDVDRRRRVVRPTPLLLEHWRAVRKAGSQLPPRARTLDDMDIAETADVD